MSALVDIDALAQDGRVKVLGVEHAVKAISAKMLTTLRADGDQIEKLLTVVCGCVPTLSREVAENLSLIQLNGILDVATASKDTVEQAAPNVEAVPPMVTPTTPA